MIVECRMNLDLFMNPDLFLSLVIRGIRNPGFRQCLGFCTVDFWSSLAYESAEQKPKHSLTPGFLIPLLVIDYLLYLALRMALLGHEGEERPGVVVGLLLGRRP